MAFHAPTSDPKIVDVVFAVPAASSNNLAVEPIVESAIATAKPVERSIPSTGEQSIAVPPALFNSSDAGLSTSLFSSAAIKKPQKIGFGS